MSLVCAQCSRVNPPEASYCYYDGAALAGRSSGPVNAGSAPFPNQFVFPNGTACRNFDQLALACQQHWAAAVDLLKQGFLGSFFGGLGRVDLAMASQEAAKFPDIDRGLDQLLAKLPTQALQAPKLQAEPSAVNLGQVKINQNRTSELHLTNLGMRLLYGNITSDCKWLAIGDAPGQSEKIFQFGSEAILPIQVRGQHLRAGSKPMEGHLVVDSNGGTATVTFTADVSITPFSGGLFDGATTPRQIAEKAKANPKECAPFFEAGTIAQWYASNGWAYPVQGPTMSGMGAIQQFFEALGVAKPPKVEFSVRSLDLRGSIGQALQAAIDVTTTERKVVYGWATCDQPWVEVGRTKLTGKVASIPLTIRIPSPCPPMLEARLNVMGNGNQKIVVPLRVAVAGGKKGVALQDPVLEVVQDVPAAMPAASPRHTPMPVASYNPAPVATASQPKPMMAVAAPAVEDNPFAVTESPGVVAAPATMPRYAPAAPGGGGLPLPVKLLLLLLPILILSMCLLGLIVRDFFWGAVRTAEGGSDDTETFADAGKIDPNPYVKLVFDEGTTGANYADTMTFAVYKINPKDKTDPGVKLNWYENGSGNSVVVRIDDRDNTFGKTQSGRWHPDKAWSVGQKVLPPDFKFGGKVRTFEFTKEGISVTQTVTIVPGDPVLVNNEYVRPLNICLARYKIENKDRRTHKVGLRVLLDTCIGSNDGVPFTLPGVKELVDGSKDFKGEGKVPDFVQVLEKPDLANPGIVVQLNLRINDKLERPSRFSLTHYPASGKNPDRRNLDKWDVPLEPFEDDSSVAIYWEEKDLTANKTREVAFAYGLGTLSAAPSNAKLAVTVGGAMQVGGELTVVALVSDPNAKKVTLKLPSGLEAFETPLEQDVVQPADTKKPRPIPVTLRVRARSPGDHDISVSTKTGLTQSRRVRITAKSLFN